MRKFITLVLTSVAMLFVMAMPAEAYRPAPGRPQPDLCRNIPGWQGMPHILYREYIRIGPKRARLCKEHPAF